MPRKTLSWLLVLTLIIGVLAFFYAQPASIPGQNQAANKQAATEETGSYQNISAKELNDWLTSGKDLLLIDVREPSEFQEGHLKGAVNIPLGQIQSRLKEIPQDKDVVVYCRSGRRSAEASNILVKNGYKRIFNLEGGIINWSYEVVKQQASSDFLKAA